jgi:serine/threonine protein kinase
LLICNQKHKKALDVAKGLQYLHQEDIIHGDLKGVKKILFIACSSYQQENFQVNILIDPSGRACLADFGLSAVADPQIMHWSSCSSMGSKGGSVRWQAPELHDSVHGEIVHNSKESDVYAWSCVCYEVT